VTALAHRYFCSPLCGGWTRAHPPRRHGIIATLDDLRAYLGADSVTGMNRRIYKDTQCGASLSVLLPDGAWRHNGQDWSDIADIRGFTIQTIVEGSDATVDSDVFLLPVRATAVTAFIREMEAEAALLWDEANTEEVS
jgi:hypothetical protein